MHSPTPSLAHLNSQEANTPRSIIPESAGNAVYPMGEEPGPADASNDFVCPTTDREHCPTYSVIEWVPALGRTRPRVFVGEAELLHYVAALGPVPIEDRANGLPHPHDPSVMCIPLPNGRAALIDAEDYPLVRPYSWQTNSMGYAISIHVFGGERLTLRLHRLVLLLGPDNEMLPDHANHDPLDNRKANLRLCTRRQNTFNTRLSSANTSGVKGVQRYKGRWRGTVGFEYRHYVREFDTCEEAEAWVRAKREELHGEFACHG